MTAPSVYAVPDDFDGDTRPQTREGDVWLRTGMAVGASPAALAVLADCLAELVYAQDTCDTTQDYALALVLRLGKLYRLTDMRRVA